MEAVTIAGRPVSGDVDPYVIAEVGANHNGDPDLLVKHVRSAATCGVDAVKFQSWTLTSLISRAEYGRHLDYPDKDRHFGSLEEMVEAYQLTPELEELAIATCREAGVAFLSSAFSADEVVHLTEVGVGAHKVASMDIDNHRLLDAVAGTRLPVILSTGMADLSEIATAVERLAARDSGPVVVLHCVSQYPTPPELLRLRNIPMLADAFGTAVGFSDHSAGSNAAAAAVALGAVVLEKHFTLDVTLPGWDHWMSAEPDVMSSYVSTVREVRRSLGSPVRVVGPEELKKREAFRRSLVVRSARPAGHVLADEDVDFKRPGTGIAPSELAAVVGRRLRRDVANDHELGWDDLA